MALGFLRFSEFYLFIYLFSGLLQSFGWGRVCSKKLGVKKVADEYIYVFVRKIFFS